MNFLVTMTEWSLGERLLKHWKRVRMFYDRMTAEDERIAEECATTGKINYTRRSQRKKFLGMSKDE